MNMVLIDTFRSDAVRGAVIMATQRFLSKYTAVSFDNCGYDLLF